MNPSSSVPRVSRGISAALLLLLTACLLVAAVFAAPADAKKKQSGPKTGMYTATSAVGSFKFKIYKGSCYVSLTRKKKTGYCISGWSDTPKVALDCPDVKDGPSDTEAFITVPNQAYLPASGKLKLTWSNAYRVGESSTSRFNLKLGKTGKGSGDFSVSEVIKSLKVTSTCSSAVVKFTAKK
jgi:hypothetical protein